MRSTWKSFGVALCVLLLALLGQYCSSPESKTEVWLNHHDSVRYVGKSTCMQCHAGIHEQFLKTGMGQSLGKARPVRSSSTFNKHAAVYDASRDLYYLPAFRGDSLTITEFRLEGRDTIHKRVQPIQYIIGSGHHTNSHLFLSGGYLFQAPLTFYTQKGIWDLPPGFENGANSRFNRLIGLECMSCHNAYPGFVQGSENKYTFVPEGIDCERCHGPGSIHVREKRAGTLVDTAKHIDYTIVNPGKLSVERQFDLCQRCHLQGNAVLKPGKSFYDFKPGMALHEVMEVYLPTYSSDSNQFIMASHADRLKKSSCFEVMSERHGDAKGLRPYRNALTCVTCHNPHVSVRERGVASFNNTCQSCHSAQKVANCGAPEVQRNAAQNNCVGCHMPVSGSVDIPHVTVHDHYIRKRPIALQEAKDRGRFLGLRCVNNPNPDIRSRLVAYVQHFEKFDVGNSVLLDSAVQLSKGIALGDTAYLGELVHLHFTRRDYAMIVRIAEASGGMQTLTRHVLTRRSWSNEDAWTAYRIGESYLNLGNTALALPYLQAANRLAPAHFEFSNKLASAFMALNRVSEAENLYRRLTVECPNYAPGWSNLGYIRLLQGYPGEAEQYYRKALGLDPDYGQAVVNLSGLLAMHQRKDEAYRLLKRYRKYATERDPIDAMLKQLEHSER